MNNTLKWSGTSKVGLQDNTNACYLTLIDPLKPCYHVQNEEWKSLMASITNDLIKAESWLARKPTFSIKERKC